MMSGLRRFVLTLGIPLATTAAPAANPRIAGHDVGRPGGLAVVAGKDADRHATELAKTGKWLVRVVARDEAHAAECRESTEALLPLVTVRVGRRRLPFAPQTVNLLVLGAGSGISREERARVIAPECVILTEDLPRWKRDVSPRDERHAPWTHWQADAHATGVSADEAVAPSNSLRWWSRRFAGAQLRTAGGVAAFWEDSNALYHVPDHVEKQHARYGIHGYDVFSGVPLWRHENVIPKPYKGRTIYAAHELGFIHPQRDELSPIVLTDARSGEIRVTYDQGLRMPVKRVYRQRKWLLEPAGALGPALDRRDGSRCEGALLVYRDTLIEVYGHEIVALDVPTGRRLWRVRMDRPSVRAIVSRDGSTLFVQEVLTARRSYLRWGSFPTAALAAYSMKDGSRIWRNADWETMETMRRGEKARGGPWLSELIEWEGTLYAWDQASNIGSDHHGDLYAIDPETGRIRWHLPDANDKNPNKEYNKHGPMTNNLVVWNGRLFTKFAEYSKVAPSRAPARFKGRYQPGMDLSAAVFLGGNQRCVRMAGAANYLVYGFTSFLAKDGTSYQTGLTRGNCAMPNYATYGAVISVTDETCSCYNGLRGQVALIPPLPLDPIAEGERVTRPEASPVAKPGASLPRSAVTNEWTPFPSMRLFWNHDTIRPRKVGALHMKIDVQRHLVTAFGNAGDARALWRYRADGRVLSLPTTDAGVAYVSSTAGTVTAVDLKTGRPHWRFLAAPARDELVINGQLESRWPVYNSVVKDGSVYVAAGRHAEVDGGLWAWKLDAKTGAVRKRFRLLQPMSALAPGGSQRDAGLAFRASREVTSNHLLLGGVALDDGGRVCLVNRKWNKSGSRASFRGYWKELSARTKDRRDNGKPDPECANRVLYPVDFDAWNGRSIDMVTALGLTRLSKKNLYYRSPLR